MMILSVRSFSIKTSSMKPYFKKGDRVLAVSMKLAFPIKRGDIVFFRANIPNPMVNSQVETLEGLLVKRVIGLPGEHLKIRDGEVHIDGQKLSDFVRGKWDIPNYSNTYIPLAEYFLMGDNRSNSTDSRNFGTVPLRDIFYKARTIYWPLWHSTIIKF